MPKKSMRSRSRSRRGGEWYNPTTWSTSSWFGSSSEEEKPLIPPPPPPPPGTGGRKGKRSRSMRGGDYTANMSLTDLAATAESVSGVPTASALFVGGRNRLGGRTRRRHRHSKSCKKSCRKH